ncbi:DUF6447 family protein [Roseibium limicola]|uniref:Uncharacterized protein n=1 Tax=Roseibium limicola TaxID=2816037 RepID=A0A939ERX3_9HYPH|nr:DUF6447 family protein [Roseibium limicola]MBO0346816.1 hypothetical protein [Roseibium limicola]
MSDTSVPNFQDAMLKQKINIDGVEYETDKLSDAAREMIVNIRVVDMKINALQQEVAIMQTAKNAYGQALKSMLPADAQAAPEGEKKTVDASSIDFLGSD